jgi:hypothetical protein
MINPQQQFIASSASQSLFVSAPFRRLQCIEMLRQESEQQVARPVPEGNEHHDNNLSANKINFDFHVFFSRECWSLPRMFQALDDPESPV